MGNFNAKVWDERLKDVVGPSCIGTVNERGSRLIEWWQINDSTITILGIKTTRGDKAWKSPGDRSRKKIRFRNAVKTSKSLPGADCDSAHIPVICKFQVKLKKLRKAKSNPKFQMDLLKSDEKLRTKIAIGVHNKYETLNNTSEVEELWSEMKNSLNEVIEKNVPQKDF
ncbi:craniofacial development protein 2-like [Plakobranchus ocellatus]|uniref:Craniofacial development protein 2-like n=1 Tax=Plakobranchus ocellatus TaxID=259542 RepID=A0AAV3YHZ1_9GAST|nr:craniofacial development protein 2-like [Plakobranchus ocellatus]